MEWKMLNKREVKIYGEPINNESVNFIQQVFSCIPVYSELKKRSIEM